MESTEIQSWIDKLPEIAKHPAFKWSVDVEGYRDYTFGAYAGAEVSIENLLHEISHAVELGAESFDKRCRNGEYFFKTPVMGTTQDLKRELRVFAIQVVLQEHIGYKTRDERVKTVEELCESLIFFDGYWVYRPKHVSGEAAMHNLRCDCMRYAEQCQPYYLIQRAVDWLEATSKRLDTEELTKGLVK